MREVFEKMRRTRITIAEGGLTRMEYPDAHAVVIMDMNQKKIRLIFILTGNSSDP